MSALVVFDADRWLRILGDVVTVGAGAPVPAADERVIAVVPAHEVVVTSALLPDLSEAQAHAAARSLIAEGSLVAPNDLHVAAGRADAAGQRLVVSMDARAVDQHLARLGALGLDPDHLLAAPLLLPQPSEGFLRGDLGGELVVRGSDTAFADDPVLTPLLTGGVLPADLDRPALERGVIAAVALPEADLRHGRFAKRRHWTPEWREVRRLALMLFALGLLILAVRVAEIVKTNAAAARIETANRASAAAVLPPGTTVTDPALQVAGRVAAVRGAGGGALPLAAAVAETVQTVAGTELAMMAYEGGALRITVRGPSPAALAGLEARLAAKGLSVDAAPITTGQPLPQRDLTVRVP